MSFMGVDFDGGGLSATDIATGLCLDSAINAANNSSSPTRVVRNESNSTLGKPRLVSYDKKPYEPSPRPVTDAPWYVRFWNWLNDF